MARRAASISRAVIRALLVAFKPNSPKETLLPRCARPAMRPLNILRYLVRLGCIMGAKTLSSCGCRRFGRRGLRARLTRLTFGCCLFQLRLVEDFTLEDPDLH